MLATRGSEFFHYTPRRAKNLATARRNAIAKRLTSKASPKKSPPTGFCQNAGEVGLITAFQLGIGGGSGVKGCGWRGDGLKGGEPVGADGFPDAAFVDRSQVEHVLALFAFPAHARLLEPLAEDRFAARLGAGTDRRWVGCRSAT
jgi:hypothetical protein